MANQIALCDCLNKGAVIVQLATRNLVALQVAERMLLVLPPFAQKNSFVAESRKSFYFEQQSRATKIRVVIRATFAPQLATQIKVARQVARFCCSYYRTLSVRLRTVIYHIRATPLIYGTRTKEIPCRDPLTRVQGKSEQLSLKDKGKNFQSPKKWKAIVLSFKSTDVPKCFEGRC